MRNKQYNTNVRYNDTQFSTKFAFCVEIAVKKCYHRLAHIQAAINNTIIGSIVKIKVKKLSYDKVVALRKEKPITPKRTGRLFRLLMKLASAGELKATNFTYSQTGMEQLGKNEPCLYLMNHSSFIDLKIVSTILFPETV